jgi:chromosome segregation ATPase
LEIHGPWKPLLPPILNLYPTNPWGSTPEENIQKKRNNRNRYNKETDSLSTTSNTATTIQTISHDSISDLNSDSALQQYSTNEHNDQFLKTEKDVQETLHNFQHLLETIDQKQQDIATNHKKFSTQITYLTNTIPSIVKTMEQLQTQLLSVISQQYDINNTYTN